MLIEGNSVTRYVTDFIRNLFFEFESEFELELELEFDRCLSLKDKVWN